MNWIRTKLDKLEERAKQHCDVLRLPDGTEIRYTGEDALDALVAVMDGESHWLLPHLRLAEPKGALSALLWMLEGDRDGS